MHYKLAKRLKDAGYEGIFFKCIRADKEHGYCRVDKPDCEIRIIGDEPNLEDLIEACGMAFQSLEYSSGMFSFRKPENMTWVAYFYDKGILCNVNGATPLEAVANLYISLRDETYSNSPPRNQ